MIAAHNRPDESDSPGGEVLELWCAYPPELEAESVERACAAVLSDEERENASRFLHDRHRRESIAAHALVRNALAHNHPLPPEAWRFQVNEFGKPAAEPACGVQFNLTTCERLVACLIAHGTEVGVDAEPTARSKEIAALEEAVFSPAERMQLKALSGEARQERALSLWVLKEAYTKARGMGLTLPLPSLSFLFGGEEGIRLEADLAVDEDPSRWRFCLVDYAGHRLAAVAAANHAKTAGASGEFHLQVMEARPPIGEPIRVALPREAWFPRSR